MATLHPRSSKLRTRSSAARPAACDCRRFGRVRSLQLFSVHLKISDARIRRILCWLPLVGVPHPSETHRVCASTPSTSCVVHQATAVFYFDYICYYRFVVQRAVGAVAPLAVTCSCAIYDLARIQHRRALCAPETFCVCSNQTHVNS